MLLSELELNYKNGIDPGSDVGCQITVSQFRNKISMLLGGPFHSGAPRLCLPCLPSRDAAVVSVAISKMIDAGNCGKLIASQFSLDYKSFAKRLQLYCMYGHIIRLVYCAIVNY